MMGLRKVLILVVVHLPLLAAPILAYVCFHVGATVSPPPESFFDVEAPGNIAFDALPIILGMSGLYLGIFVHIVLVRRFLEPWDANVTTGDEA